MVTDYALVKRMVLELLKTEEDTTYPDTLLFDGICGALDAILPWCPRRAIFTTDADTMERDRFKLPDNCYQVEAVQELKTGVFMERALLTGSITRNALSNTRAVGFDWLEYPTGYLYMSKTIAAGEKIAVYYQAYYPKPNSETDDGFIFETPRAALTGLVYWAAAHCLIPSANASAQIRQFNMRIDSGVPTDNALEMQARFLRALFMEEMNRLPKSLGATK